MRMLFVTSTLSLLFVLASCVQQAKSAHPEKEESPLTRSVAVQPFDALQASGVFELLLSQGATEGVRIEAPEHLHHHFQVRNEGATLIVETKSLKGNAIRPGNAMRVHVTFKNLKDLRLNTVGSTRSEGRLVFDQLHLLNKSVGQVHLELTANKLTVKTSSVGSMILSGTAVDVVFEKSGVGSLEAGNLMAQTVSINNSGIGSAEVNASRELWVTDHWLSKVRNKGVATAKK